MIPDKIFKNLIHAYKGYEVFLKGNALEQGYKPDYVLKKGDDYIILESENSSSRKTFVGGMIKAAHFLQDKKTGILIFVMVPKKNTKVVSITNHLIPYFKWVKQKTNLREIFVIEAKIYFNKQIVLAIDGKDFKK